VRELLTRHFVRRFIDNDLISPDADRHSVLAVAGAALISCSLFLTAALTFKYSFGIELPGPAALWALNDRFLYIAGSMVVTALATLAVWDALGLDARDASILGPLPIARGVIVRAKLTAVMLFGLACTVAINVVPTLLHPVLVLAKLYPSAEGLFRVIVVHGIVTIGAGLFGFMVVVTLRALSQVLLGQALFARLSAAIQAGLVLILVSTLFLLPGLASNVSATWLTTHESSRALVPPLWFLGLYETAAGDVVVNSLGDRLDPKAPRLAYLVATNQQAVDTYHRHRDIFRELARLAGVATVLVSVIAIAACGWSYRRPTLRPPARARRGIFTVLARIGAPLVIRGPVARAGFFFTLHTLARNPSHRIVIAATGGIGLAAAIATLGGRDIQHTIATQMPLTVVLAAQFIFVSCLAIGFRHAVRVPAELAANWIFQIAWPGDERAYLSGVKKAAMFGLVLPAVVALLPLNVLILGSRLAALHGAVGLLGGMICLEMLLWNLRRPAFACSYLPGSGVKAPIMPLALAAFAGVTYGFATIERLALENPASTAQLLVGLLVSYALARVVDLWKRRRRVSVVFNELPDPATQRFELNG
jgi:hypothetical protein